MIEVMEQRLEMKKKRLEQLQEYFRIDIMNINQSTYEDNAISALLEMKKIKTEIAELELCLQLKWLIYGGNDYMNRLYLVHDEDYNYQIVVSANSAISAIEKLQNFIKETKQTGEFWIKTKWIASLCDNDKVLE